ncbi:MAG: transporter, partial [Flavisolibacter sp.]|nr:transporter [Flavisolibacter sp.]
MKRLLWIWVMMSPWCKGITQTLSLEEAQQLARINYPLMSQKDLLEKTGQYTLENIAKGKLPQLMLAGQATYQSEVTEIPIKIPNQNIPTLSKDQYRLYAEVIQPISDRATVRQQEKVQRAINQNALDKLEVELYSLKERVNNLYFGILLIDEQKRINQLARQDLQTGINKITAAINNGTDYRSSLDKLNTEVLHLDEKDIELNAERRALLQVLSQFMGKRLSDSVHLQIPAERTMDATIRRPELRVFESQHAIYDAQQQLLHRKIWPKL